MLNRVRKFLKNNSPDWLNTEVNKDLLQNLSAAFSEAALGAIAPTQTPLSSTSYDENCSPRPELGEGLGVRANTQLTSSLNHSSINNSLSTDRCSPFTLKGKPHWRRINQVFQTLDNAPQFASYNQLIEYVRETTGVGCSRKLISKWKKQNTSHKSEVKSHKFPDHNNDRHLEKSTAASAFFPTSIPSTLYSFQFTETSNHSTKSDSFSTEKLCRNLNRTQGCGTSSKPRD
jgi:hypothetical protein